MTTEHAIEAGHAAPANATEYISHHLAHLKSADGAFNLDTFWVSAIMGFVFLAVFYMASRRATAGVPGKLQNFVEMIMEMVNETINGAFTQKARSSRRWPSRFSCGSGC